MFSIFCRLEVQPLKCQKWTKEFVHDLGKLLSPVEPVLMSDGMLKMGNDYYRKGEFCVNGLVMRINLITKFYNKI